MDDIVVLEVLGVLEKIASELVDPADDSITVEEIDEFCQEKGREIYDLIEKLKPSC